MLITADKDFGVLVFRRRLIHHGVILTRLENYTPEIRARLITEFILSNEEIIQNSFTVISNRGIRIRHREN